MSVLNGMQPERVWHYFSEICKIPHGSGNVKGISDYLVNFAKEHGLSYKQDEMLNVIIKKDATPGYEKEAPIILQGHMDMVAVKTPESSIDLKKDGLNLCVDGDNLYAKDTSLGGDDGIAVAYALAILESGDIVHPALEVIVTVDEEVGMDGARAIDLTGLQGKRMLNIDSEEEGIFLTSCAGGGCIRTYLPVDVKITEGIACRISVEGLLGGHSGEMIDKERGNSNCLMGRLFYRLTEQMPVYLKELEGGLADNAIPRRTIAQVLIDEDKEELFKDIVQKVETEIQTELATKDPDFEITVVILGEDKAVCTEEESTANLASYLMALPNGVQAMSADVEGLVETSLNLGILKYDAEEQEITCAISVRSCIESAKKALLDKVSAVTELAGGHYAVSGEYPGWAYRVESPFRDLCVSVYEEMYGRKPVLRAIHAGLECGIIASKIEDLDCISIGPDMEDIHTTEEKLSISSTARVWDFIIKVLSKKDN